MSSYECWLLWSYDNPANFSVWWICSSSTRFIWYRHYDKILPHQMINVWHSIAQHFINVSINKCTHSFYGWDYFIFWLSFYLGLKIVLFAVVYRCKCGTGEDRVPEQYIQTKGGFAGYRWKSGYSLVYDLYSQLWALVGCGSWFTDGRQLCLCYQRPSPTTRSVLS